MKTIENLISTYPVALYGNSLETYMNLWGEGVHYRISPTLTLKSRNELSAFMKENYFSGDGAHGYYCAINPVIHTVSEDQANFNFDLLGDSGDGLRPLGKYRNCEAMKTINGWKITKLNFFAF
ncbi:MAG: hypothetical protein F6J87_22540 [Spirulina sp. SIO3F2]|nr:hypothetical protein [Spirulina sp. SIO3F2]